MECRRGILLRKKQWDRLKNEAGYQKSPKETWSEEKIKYLAALDEKSRSWKKHWPDTAEGMAILHEERKKRITKKNLEFIKAYEEERKNLLKQATTDELKQAKKKIFNTSCHGVQLIGALREGKVREEREAQIEFNKMLKKNQAEHDKKLNDKIDAMKNNLYDFHTRDEENTKKSILLDAEAKKINKKISDKNNLNRKNAKKEAQHARMEDEKYEKQMSEIEAHLKDNTKELREKEFAEYFAEKKAVEEARLQRQVLEEKLNEVYNSYKDRQRRLEKQVWDKIIKGRFESDRHKKIYADLDDNLKKEQKIYDDFVNVGIERAEKRRLKAEEKQKHQEKESQNKELHKVKEYKEAIEMQDIKRHANKYLVHRSSLFTKPHPRIVKEVRCEHSAATGVPRDSFRLPCRKLVDAVRRREKQPSSWTALDGTHRYFAEQAGAALHESKDKHKHFVRRVINDYRKTHCLDAKTLPVQNY